MSFINDIRKRMIKKSGIETPIAENNGNKQGFLVSIAIPMVSFWDKVSGKKGNGKTITPKSVPHIPIFGDSLKEVMAELKQKNGTTTAKTLKSNWFGRVFQNVFTRKRELKRDGLLSAFEKNAKEFDRVITQQEEKERYGLGENGLFPVSIDDEETQQITQQHDEDCYLIPKSSNGKEEEHIYDEVASDIPSLPLPPEKKVGLAQKMKNMVKNVVDFFVNPSRSKQTAPIDKNLINVNWGWCEKLTLNHVNTESRFKTIDLHDKTAIPSNCLKKTNTTPQDTIKKTGNSIF